MISKKLELKDLIKGKYYCVVFKNTTEYIRYKYHDNEYLYSNYYVAINNGDNSGIFIDNIRFFCDMIRYGELEVVKEVDLKEFVQYLPKNHPDIREHKINCLLAIKEQL